MKDVNMGCKLGQKKPGEWYIFMQYNPEIEIRVPSTIVESFSPLTEERLNDLAYMLVGIFAQGRRVGQKEGLASQKQILLEMAEQLTEMAE
jgi:hypothetical protein